MVESGERSGFEMAQHFGDGRAITQWNALQDCVAAHHGPFERDAAVEPRCGADYVRNAGEFREEPLPVFNAEFRVAFEDVDRRGGAGKSGSEGTRKTIFWS